MEQERQYKFDFANDIQLICKYLGRLQLELNFEETGDKSQNIMRMLEAHPSTPSFKKGLISVFSGRTDFNFSRSCG